MNYDDCYSAVDVTLKGTRVDIGKLRRSSCSALDTDLKVLKALGLISRDFIDLRAVL